MSEFDGKALADKNGDTLRFTPTHFLDGNTVKELATEFGKKLDKTGDGKDVTVTFSQASSRGTAANDFASGSTLATLLGKMKKWFASLGALAFKDSVSGNEIGSHTHPGSDIKFEHTDEINFSKNSNDSYSSVVYFNYRDGNTDNVNPTNLIAGYKFCNRNGSITGVTLYADQFSGNAATASKWASSIRLNIRDAWNHYGLNCDIDGSGNVEAALPNTIQAVKFIGPLQGSVTGDVTGNVTGNCSGSSGSCTGNAATATKATKDGDGNDIASAKAFRWNSFGVNCTFADTWHVGSNLTVKNSYSLIQFSDNQSDNLPLSGIWLKASSSGDDVQPAVNGGWRECIVTIDITLMYTATISQMCTVELVTTDGSNYVPFCARSATRFFTIGDGAPHQVNLHCAFTLRRDDGDISSHASAANDRPCKPAIIRVNNSGTVVIADWVIWTRVLGRRYKSSETHPYG